MRLWFLMLQVRIFGLHRKALTIIYGFSIFPMECSMMIMGKIIIILFEPFGLFNNLIIQLKRGAQ